MKWAFNIIAHREGSKIHRTLDIIEASSEFEAKGKVYEIAKRAYPHFHTIIDVVSCDKNQVDINKVTVLAY